MDTQAEQVLQTALSLSADDRAEIVDSLLVSIDEERAAEIEAAWAEVIKRRIDQIDTGQVKLIPSDEVMRSMRERLNG
jgi:putative addiction module component (TIGR02574 family)